MRDNKWIPVKGYEGIYEINAEGNVKSLKRNTTSGGIMKQYVNPRNGYVYVCLSKNGVVKQHRIHKLVYTSFHPEVEYGGYSKYKTIDHIDGDKTNNRLDNLELCTQSENQLRAYANGLNGKVTKKVIDLTDMIVYESETEAVRSVGGKRCSMIHRVCTGKRSQYRNHVYAFYDDYVNGTIPKFNGRAKRSCEKLWR